MAGSPSGTRITPLDYPVWRSPSSFLPRLGCPTLHSRQQSGEIQYIFQHWVLLFLRGMSLQLYQIKKPAEAGCLTLGGLFYAALWAVGCSSEQSSFLCIRYLLSLGPLGRGWWVRVLQLVQREGRLLQLPACPQNC